MDKLKELPEFNNVLLVGNPIYEGMNKDEAKIKTLSKLPNLATVDGKIVDETLKEQAKALEGPK